MCLKKLDFFLVENSSKINLKYLLDLNFFISKRFGSGSVFSCMRFEAIHQRLKRFAKNCGYKNAAKTIADKYCKRLNMIIINPSKFENPFLKTIIEIEKNRSDTITSISFLGISIKLKKDIILSTRDKNLFMPKSITENNGDYFVEGLKINILSFSNELLAYEIDITAELVSHQIFNIQPILGSLYNLSNKIYCLFRNYL